MGVGLDHELHYDSAGVGVGTWAEIKKAQDVTLNQTHQETAVNDRSSDDEEYLIGQKVRSIDFQMTYNNAAAAYEALRDAFNNKTDIGIACMDGPIATSGSEGLQANMKVTQFTRNEPVNGVVTASVTLKPSAASSVRPAWVEVV